MRNWIGSKVEADAYDEEAVEEFSEVLYTLREVEVAGWLRSLQLRGINLPDALKDEAFLIIGERRTHYLGNESYGFIAICLFQNALIGSLLTAICLWDCRDLHRIRRLVFISGGDHACFVRWFGLGFLSGEQIRS